MKLNKLFVSKVLLSVQSVTSATRVCKFLIYSGANQKLARFGHVRHVRICKISDDMHKTTAKNVSRYIWCFGHDCKHSYYLVFYFINRCIHKNEFWILILDQNTVVCRLDRALYWSHKGLQVIGVCNPFGNN